MEHAKAMSKKLGELALLKQYIKIPNCFNNETCLITAKCEFDRQKFVIQVTKDKEAYEFRKQDFKLSSKSIQ